MSNTIGQRIKELRQSEGLSQSQLGKKLNVSQDTVSLWENGKNQPNTEYVILLAKFFGESTDYILGLNDD